MNDVTVAKDENLPTYYAIQGIKEEQTKLEMVLRTLREKLTPYLTPEIPTKEEQRSPDFVASPTLLALDALRKMMACTVADVINIKDRVV